MNGLLVGGAAFCIAGGLGALAVNIVAWVRGLSDLEYWSSGILAVTSWILVPACLLSGDWVAAAENAVLSVIWPLDWWRQRRSRS